RRDKNDAVAVRAVTGNHKQRIRRSWNIRRHTGWQIGRGRESLLQKRCRNIKLIRRILLPEIVPVRQGPSGWAAEGNNVLANLILQGDQVAAMPWRKIPGGVLALTPALHVGG